MNIDDVKEVEDVASHEIIATIFQKQKLLMAKYEPIEASNGAIVPERPWKIDDKFVQMRLKDMFFRTTEEICEALENSHMLDNFGDWQNRWEKDHHIRHFFEEMIDALHFLTEASVMAGLDPLQIQKRHETLVKNDTTEFVKGREVDVKTLNSLCMTIIKKMGLAANCLKNKPWKNTHMTTDQDKFKILLYGCWFEYLFTLEYLGMGLTGIFEIYSKKNSVNQFRIRSNY